MAETTDSAVIYAAKSTEDKHGSIPAQIDDCRAMAQREGWTVVGEYTDEAFSAYRGNRGPGLEEAKQAAIATAAEHGRCLLVAQDGDRFARGAGDAPGAADHLGEVYFAMKRQGVELWTVRSGKLDLIRAALEGERATGESARKTQNVAGARRRLRERGGWSGRAPDGYFVERNLAGAAVTHRLVIDPEREPVYRRLWQLAVEGASTGAIVRDLAAHGYRTVSYNGSKPKPFGGARVRTALDNPAYAGLVAHHDEVVGPGDWEAYISPDEWWRLRRKRSSDPRRSGAGRPCVSLLGKLAFCGECGGPLVYQRGHVRRDGTRRDTYSCIAHRDNPASCGARPCDANLAAQTVLENLDRLVADADSLAGALTSARDQHLTRLAKEASSAAAEIAEHEQAVAKITARYEKAVAADNDAGVELAERSLEKHRQERERIELRQRAAEDALAAVEAEPAEDADTALARLLSGLGTALSGAADDVRARNEALRGVFDRLYLSEGGASIVPVLGDASSPGEILNVEAYSVGPDGDGGLSIEPTGQVYGVAAGTLGPAHELSAETVACRRRGS